MNKLKHITALVALFTAFIFSSCETEPIDPAVLDNLSCAAPTSFQSSEFVGTTVTLSWASTSGGSTFEVEYGSTGFTQGEGTLVIVNTTSLAIAELVAANDYDFYVRSLCPNGIISEWVGPIQVGEIAPIPTGPAVFKADFDAQTYTATLTQAFISGGSITITAAKASGESFGFILDGTTVGTYQAKDHLVAYNVSATAENSYIATNPNDGSFNTGTIIITAINTTNNTISGTFSFTAYLSGDTNLVTGVTEILDTKEFTNGVFTNIPFQADNINNNTFSATVDGSAFDEVDVLGVLTQVEGIEVISIGAVDAFDDAITVTMRSNLGIGTYTITGSLIEDVVQINYALNNGEFSAFASSGTVTILEKTAETIKGTFSGTVVIGGTTYVITAGTFDATY